MRLVIDLQGAQGESRLRGIGRYSRELALAMARVPGPHEVIIALNGALPHAELRSAFREILPPEAVRVWEGIPDTAGIDPASAPRRAAAETLRAQVLAALEPDMLHVSSMFEGLSDDVVSGWPTGLERLPTVATCYDLIPLIQRADYLDTAWRGPVSRWYFRRLQEISLCDGLLAISESSRREAIEHLGYSEKQVFNIRAGISGHFAPRPARGATRAALLSRLGLRDDFLLFVGAGDRRKNEVALIQAYGLLPPALRTAHQLVIVGKTSPEELGRAAAEAGVRMADVVLLPFVEEEELPALYSACILFVLPSLHEGFGLPAAEAMACGAPTIASNTTSLPEVIGRADALFDPTRPESIAERMHAVLTGPALRHSLAEHGLRQAGGFTWEESARRAWSGLEAVLERGGAIRPRPTALGRRLRLAFVSPLPPDESGIADFAPDLACALARHYDLTLICDRGTTDNERLRANFPVLDPDSFLASATRYDRVLYHVGNSDFHARQIEELLPAVPGVVTLHDAYLSSLMAWLSDQAGGPFRFRLDLLRSHGWPAVVLAASDPMAALWQYPCSLAVLRAALGTVQHSRYAHDIAEHHYSPGVARNIAVIPLLHAVTPSADRLAARQQLGVAEDAFLVCSFGVVARRKLPDRILAAWPAVAAADPAATLVFVGEALSEVADIVGSAAASRAAMSRVTGRVDAATYRLWLAAADVAVQLRTASRGETSGAVTDCLAAGLPVIANAEGAIAELPDGVIRVLPAEVEPDGLAVAINALRDPAAQAALSAGGLRYVRDRLAPDRVAAMYRDVIEAAYTTGPAACAHAATLGAAETVALDAKSLAAVARAIARSFPAPGPPQLLLDAGLLEGPEDDLGPWVAACLGSHAPGLRVHLVQGNGTPLRTAPALACGLLGLDATGLDPETVTLRLGDVVLLAPARSALAEADITSARRSGAVVLGLADFGAGPTSGTVVLDGQVFCKRRKAMMAMPPGGAAPGICLEDLSAAEAVSALLGKIGAGQVGRRVPDLPV